VDVVSVGELPPVFVERYDVAGARGTTLCGDPASLGHG